MLLLPVLAVVLMQCIFHPFIDIKETRLIGVEAGGEGVSTGEHAAPLNDGIPEFFMVHAVT